MKKQQIFYDWKTSINDNSYIEAYHMPEPGSKAQSSPIKLLTILHDGVLFLTCLFEKKDIIEGINSTMWNIRVVYKMRTPLYLSSPRS